MSRIRLDFEYSSICEIDELGVVLKRNITRNMKSLALFLKQKQSHFQEVIRVIALSHKYIQHLEIHEIFPTEIEEDLPLPANSCDLDIRVETLVFRPPPPGLPEEPEVSDDLNLCLCWITNPNWSPQSCREINHANPTNTNTIDLYRSWKRLRIPKEPKYWCYNWGVFNYPERTGMGFGKIDIIFLYSTRVRRDRINETGGLHNAQVSKVLMVKLYGHTVMSAPTVHVLKNS